MNYTCISQGLDDLLPAPEAAHRGGERRMELRPNRAVPVDAVRGTVVRSLRGKVWLTQEGHCQDYILVGGMSYVSLDSGRIVLNAPEDVSVASVYRIELAPGRRGCDALVHVGADTIARIERDARHAQAVEVWRWLGMLTDALAGAWRKLWGRYKPAGIKSE